MKAITKIAAAGALMLLAACGVKDPIYNTPHPGHGTVTLTTDWSRIGEGLTAPESYTAAATLNGTAAKAPDYTATLTGVTNRLDHLFAPGKYRVCVYNTPEHITVTGTAATVTEASGNVDGVGKFVNSAPGWLFASVAGMTIIQDAEHTQTATMQQQVRQLTLIVELTGGTVGRVDRIEGYLTGVASTLDLSTGTHAEPRNAELQFSRITSGPDAGKWSATVRLLGIAGEQQKLNARIFFTGNTPRSVALDSDLSKELAAFNADKRIPLTLGGSIMETPTETGFGATIVDWKPGTGGPVVAD